MTDGILYRHPGTGRVQIVARGWSWGLFLFSGCFGIPLFFRGLAVWGAIMCVIGVLGFLSYIHPDGEIAGRLSMMVSVIYGLVSLWLGFQGNAIAAAHLETCGWEKVEVALPS
ncbi:hypothetical protein [Govanella unica]|uniref:Uncharacterized protein n=1 Tax=Govanella unica TaxID=2975056 RepID=A0A9X3TW31_9PROT|nr:hypothetical protein [Govania unica]MDA5192747.1 hypothetical protein [Govania unica]